MAEAYPERLKLARHMFNEAKAYLVKGDPIQSSEKL